ncbi:hypothetical protein AURDEDRAFT_185696 [Auricularia subglabra TFB-10046 SS5]|nr:hypothetical protein AURDEDRAFT_185696 [Auricularia subglabra TFB-10046 SS5]
MAAERIADSWDRNHALSESQFTQLLTAPASALAISELSMPAMSKLAALPPRPVVVPPFVPEVGEVILAVVSLRGALNKIAQNFATSKNIDLTLPDPRPPPKGSDARPCIYFGRAQGGHYAFPLASFNGELPETWDMLLQKVVIPIGDASSVLPVFEGRPRFQTKPGWRHRDGRPTYIVPQRIFIPETTAIESSYRYLPRRIVARLQVCCRTIIGELAGSSQQDAEMMLDSYTTFVYGLPLASMRPGSPDVEEADHPAEDIVPSSSDQSVPLSAAQDSVPPAYQSSSLNPLARPFVPMLSSNSRNAFVGIAHHDPFDVVSRLSLVSCAASAAPASILSVLDDANSTWTDDAVSYPQHKPGRAPTLQAAADSSLNPFAASFTSQICLVHSASAISSTELCHVVCERLSAVGHTNTHALVTSLSLHPMDTCDATDTAPNSTRPPKRTTAGDADKENRPA